MEPLYRARWTPLRHRCHQTPLRSEAPLICEEELVEGTAITVRCGLPGPDGEVPIEQRAQVRTVSMYGRTPGGTTLHHYGLAFTNGSEDVREQILTSVIWNLTHNPAVL